MMARGIHILQPGLLSTVQDLGRHGYRRYGMPVAGAMDPPALMLANLLAGNPPGAAGIEATLTGPEIEFTEPGAIALGGAGMRPLLNGQAVPLWRALRVRAGDRLGFEPADRGCRMYIAFGGGLDVPPVMGSRSTYLRAGLGGFRGRALRRGDVLPLGRVQKAARGWLTGKERALPRELVPLYDLGGPLRILPGPETGRLAFEGLKHLITGRFEVSARSDRMGYRLEGEPVLLKPPGSDIVSSGLVRGTIQVPSDGQPILMMADHQTTGGYARIAVVASADLPVLAQLRPGDALCFRETGREEAERLAGERARALLLYGNALQL
jgi:antagonist of KipI